MDYNRAERHYLINRLHLKRLGRGFRNFEHFRNRFLYAARKAPVLNGVSDYQPVMYFDDDDN